MVSQSGSRGYTLMERLLSGQWSRRPSMTQKIIAKEAAILSAMSKHIKGNVLDEDAQAAGTTIFLQNVEEIHKACS